NLLALMVVWGYPCESKSSPAHYSKHPNLKRGRGVFLLCGDFMSNALDIKFNSIYKKIKLI
ncbi:hypothetical protein, partial [Acinetobacter nosocomialis]|uniref:hypothetical protein n=1 Tax=Acinetobacter nosocomialis TaxID=106654 RepID=UPI00301961A7